MEADAGLHVDGGIVIDAGLDAGASLVDGGLVVDAGLDAGGSQADAGADAGADGGSSAPCPCPVNCVLNSDGGSCQWSMCGAQAESWATTSQCTLPVPAGHDGDILLCSQQPSGAAVWSVKATCDAGCGGGFIGFCNTGRLWVATDPGSTAACPTAEQSYWSCIFDHSNFNALATAYQYYAWGARALSWGGQATLSSACPYSTASSETFFADSATAQCIASQTGWPLGDGDEILYIPNISGCGVAGGVGGRNARAVATLGGVPFGISIAETFCSDTCDDQEWTGFHEVFEGVTSGQSADCCNGQNGCASPVPNGAYSTTACGLTLSAAETNPPANEFDAAYCAELTFH